MAFVGVRLATGWMVACVLALATPALGEEWDAVAAETSAMALSTETYRLRDGLAGAPRAEDPIAQARTTFAVAELERLAADIDALASRLRGGAGLEETEAEFRRLQSRIQHLVSVGAESSGGALSSQDLDALKSLWEALGAQYTKRSR